MGLAPDSIDRQWRPLHYAAVGHTSGLRNWGDAEEERRITDIWLSHEPLESLLEKSLTHGHCVWCQGVMDVGTTPPTEVADGSAWRWLYTYARCPGCGWWVVRHEENHVLGDFVEPHTSYAYALLAEFDVSALDVPIELARDFLARHPSHIAHFDPYRFEALIRSCLRDRYPGAEVIALGGRRDRGIDLKVVTTDEGPILVQVKHRSLNLTGPEGVEVVRSLHGVMLREGVFRGAVLSAAPRFTRGAHMEVAMVAERVESYTMDLLPFDDIVHLLQISRGSVAADPWRGFGIDLQREQPGFPYASMWVPHGVLTQAEQAPETVHIVQSTIQDLWA